MDTTTSKGREEKDLDHQTVTNFTKRRVPPPHLPEELIEYLAGHRNLV